MSTILTVSSLSKTYASGFVALRDVSLEIKRGEIFALLGPNGAGKTTLINIVCGIVRPSAGRVVADGHDIISDFRAARAKIGLVPQELSSDVFETVWASVKFSRGLFGKPPNPAFLEALLRRLALWDKKDEKIMTLSGGMKRRVMIAKALAHEPNILFLDEPTAGVDVELRRSMWQAVRDLKAQGVTIILTTHYLEEAQEMADRIGVINNGALMLVDDKDVLMKRMGRKTLTLHLSARLSAAPDALAPYGPTLSEDGRDLIFIYDEARPNEGVAALLNAVNAAGIEYTDLQMSQSSLEDIFISLVRA